MIYLFTDYENITDDLVHELINKLPEKRKKRAMHIKHTGGQISCTIGYLLFLYGYRELYHLSDLPDFSIAPNKKPYLSNTPEIHFNISHCNGAAACILGNSPVGLDIQDIRELNMRSMRKVCSIEEQKLVEKSSFPALEFCRIWSIKESISKLSGEGIFRNIKNINEHNSHTSTFFIEPNKYLTASALDITTEFTIHIVSLKNLINL